MGKVAFAGLVSSAMSGFFIGLNTDVMTGLISAAVVFAIFMVIVPFIYIATKDHK